MRRREFIALIGGAAATWPVIGRAQQPAMPVIGYLANQNPDTVNRALTDIRGGLLETGYVEGRNLAIEYRWAEHRLERLPALAADLVRRRVALIIAPSTPSALAAKAETHSIPIVFQIAGDPGSGLALSPVSTGLAAISPAYPIFLPKRPENALSSCTKWCLRRYRWHCSPT